MNSAAPDGDACSCRRKARTRIGGAIATALAVALVVAGIGRPQASNLAGAQSGTGPVIPDFAATVAEEESAQEALLRDIRRAITESDGPGPHWGQGWNESEPRRRAGCEGGVRALSASMTAPPLRTAPATGPGPSTWGLWSGETTARAQLAGYLPALSGTIGPAEYYLELRRSDGARLVLTTSPRAGTTLAVTGGCLASLD